MLPLCRLGPEPRQTLKDPSTAKLRGTPFPGDILISTLFSEASPRRNGECVAPGLLPTLQPVQRCTRTVSPVITPEYSGLKRVVPLLFTTHSVPEKGLEPLRPYGQRILSPPWLPLHHSGIVEGIRTIPS